MGTVAHFERWAHRLKLDNGRWWTLEPFQRAIVADVLAGITEVWVVIPEGNAKTTLLAGVALYHGDHVESAFVPIGASSREQAEIMYRQAEGFVLRSPAIRGHFQCQEGHRRIKCLRTFGRIQVYAADDRTADGVIPTLALLDELHRHKNLRLYRTWRGKLGKRGGQIATISTAGEPGSEFEELRARILKHARKVRRRGCYIRAEDEDLVLHDFAVRDRRKVNDIRVVAQANPLRAITQRALRLKRRSQTTSDEHWERFVCNLATRMSGQGVKPEEWDRLYEEGVEADPGARAFGWLDLGWTIDTTAMGVVAWEALDRRVIDGVRVLRPPVDEADVVVGLLELQAEFEPEGIVYDPNAGGRQMAQLLEKGEHPLQKDDEAREEKGLEPLNGRRLDPLIFFEHSQDNAPMALAATRFEEALRNRWFRHNGDRDLRRHILNAVRKSLGGEKFKYDRPADAKGAKRKQFPIDAFTGVLMGNSVAVAQHDDLPLDPSAYIPEFA